MKNSGGKANPVMSVAFTEKIKDGIRSKFISGTLAIKIVSAGFKYTKLEIVILDNDTQEPLVEVAKVTLRTGDAVILKDLEKAFTVYFNSENV